MTTVRAPGPSTHPQRVAGALLMALGASTMLGWISRHPGLFELVHGLVPMVFNAGASFFLCGAALVLSGSQANSARRVRSIICLAVACLTGATLTEVAFDHDLGVDLPSLHTWYDYGNTQPGRMAPNTALAFLLISCGLWLRDRVNNRRAAIATIALTFTVMTVGTVGLVGYLLAPDLLFGWARSARMALHTALGVIVASFGLWFTWSRSEWYAGERYFHEGVKIRFLSAAVLVVVTLTAGLSGFVLLQRSFEISLEGRLTTITQTRSPWLRALVTEVVRSTGNAAETAGLPIAGRPVTTTAPGKVDLEASARKLLREGYRRVTYADATGKPLAAYGAVTGSTEFDAPLEASGTAALVWHEELRVRTRHALAPMADMTMPAASVEVESEASRIAPLMFGVGGLGATAQVTACQRQADTLVCLPDAANTTLFRVPVRRAPQQPLPMQRALGGTGPGIVHGLDYRGRNVIAAYAALAPGLGLVAKQDAVEAFAPIRGALALGAPVIALLAIAGAVAMYSQLNPLVRRMRRSERDIAAALAKNVAVREAVSDGIMTLDADGRIESSNAAAHAMFGLSPGHMEGLDFFALLPERVRVQQRADFRAAVTGAESDLLELRNLELPGMRADGTEFPLELTLNTIENSPQRLFVAVMRDITARKTTEEVLSRMAKFDALTGLPNRALFNDRLRTALARTRRSGHPLALMFLDLDGFKAINDQHGHLAGDELLKQVAARLTGVVRKTDTVARLAGDEFTILLEDLKKGPEDAQYVAEKAVVAMRDAFLVDDRQLRVTVSVGMVLHDPHVDGAIEASDLLKRADQSMYEVKRNGKNGFAFATDVGAHSPASSGHWG